MIGRKQGRVEGSTLTTASAETPDKKSSKKSSKQPPKKSKRDTGQTAGSSSGGSAEKRVGMFVDGNRVTVVDVVGDMAVSVASAAAPSLAESVDVALAGVKVRRNDPAIRLAMVAPGVTLRRFDATADMLVSRSRFLDAVFSVLPVRRDVSAAAGAVFDPDALVGDLTGPGVAIVAPSTVVDDGYRAVGRRSVEIVASPLVLLDDGIWLGVHESVTDLTLVENQRPVAYRQLRAGGLSGVASVLGGNEDFELGRRRALSAITGTGDSDHVAKVEVARFMRMVSAEVVQTLEFWRRSGERVPAERRINGAGLGGGSALCMAAFQEAGYEVTTPDRLNRLMGYIPPVSRADATFAYLAAMTSGSMMPQVAFVDPRLVERELSKGSRRSRLLSTAAFSVLGIVLLWTVAFPLGRGWFQSRAANERFDREQERFLRVESVFNQTVEASVLRSIVEQAAQLPVWSEAFDRIVLGLPAGAMVQQVSAVLEAPQSVAESGNSGDPAPSPIRFTVAVDIPGGSPQDVSNLLSALGRISGVTDVWTNGFTTTETGVSVQFTFLYLQSPDVSDPQVTP